MTEVNQNPAPADGRRRKWPWLLAGGLLALLLLVWVGASPFITRKIETALREALAKRSLVMEWQGGAWDPIRGMHLSEVKLMSTADGGKKPIAESDNLRVSFSLWQFISRGNDRVVYCATDDAKITLTDAEGPVSLEEVTLRVEVRPRQDIRVTRGHARKAGATADATGEILLSAVPKPSSGQPFSLKLGALRATLASLEFREGTGPFKIQGKFHVDQSGEQHTWNVIADATGTKVEYRGVRLDKAKGSVDLKSDGVSLIKTDTWAEYGEVRGEITRENWHADTPLRFHGTARDTQGRESGLKGFYQDKTFVLEQLAGSADLLEMSKAASDVVKIPRDKVKISAFENVDIRNLRWHVEKKPGLTVESVSVKGGTAAVDVGGENVELKNLSVSASNDGKAWKIREAKAGVFGGTLTARGNYADEKLRDARISGESLRMAELKLPGGDDSGKERPGILFFNWTGTLDFEGKAMDGSGSMRMDKAPVVQVPLLDQVYELFAAVVPGIDRAKDGSFEADFKGDGDLVNVTRFEARGGSLTVSATGTVNLEKKRVDGKARGKLNGLPGLVTSPLSRMLEMEVGGPYDDIRIKPLGGARLVSNAASGTVGVAVDTIQEGAKITGTVIKEGIKMPFRLLGGKKDGEKKE